MGVGRQRKPELIGVTLVVEKGIFDELIVTSSGSLL